MVLHVPCPCRVRQRLRRPGVHTQGTCPGLPRPPPVSTRCWQSVEFTWEFPRHRSWGVHSVEPTSVLPRIRMLGMPCVQSRREGASALAPSCAVRGGSWTGVRLKPTGAARRHGMGASELRAPCSGDVGVDGVPLCLLSTPPPPISATQSGCHAERWHPLAPPQPH
jgi:hypothetical protein